MSAHAALMPSAAGRWVRCPGSVAMEQRYPDDVESVKAREGTAAHWACAELLAGQAIAVGQVAPNGVVLDDEMIDGAQLYFDALMTARGPNVDMLAVGVGGTIHVEQRIDIPYVHAQNWGTPDAWFYDKAAGVLYVCDYKFGHGFVEVFENWQLIDYACGILDALGIDGAADQHIDVVMTIVQPRSYHKDGPVRTWRVKACDLRPYFNRLQVAAAAALEPGAPCRISAECKHCNARHACEALQRAALDAVDLSTTSSPVELPPDALGQELRTLQRAAALLAARISGMEEVALSTIRRGALVPGFKIEHGKGRKRWNKPVEQVVVMAKLMNVDVAKSLEAITPAQAIKAGLPADLVDMFSETPTGAAKIVADDGTLARRVFGKSY